MIRHNSCDLSSPLYSPVSSSSDTSDHHQEAVGYTCDFLQSKLATGNDRALVSRLLTAETLLELNAKDVLDQELKMKSEDKTAIKLQMDNLPPCKRSRGSTAVISPESANNKANNRRYRTQFTQTQLELMETTFQAQNYPSSVLRQQIYEMTGIPKDNIKVWFQNRRAREKRKMLRHQRLDTSSITKPDSTPVYKTPSPPPAQQPVTMTTMHWNDGESTSSSNNPPPLYNHTHQWNVPGTQNRQNWYWASAYHPYDNATAVPASVPSTVHPLHPSSMSSLNTLPPLNATSMPPMTTTGSMLSSSNSTSPMNYNTTMLPPKYPQPVPSTSSPLTAPISENVVLNTGLHPWSANVFTSL